MSIHKLTAGMGYEYLIRQVAAWDGTSRHGVALTTYYTEKGETPGVWVGSGMEGITGLSAGDLVLPEHMESLFRFGMHPLAAERLREFDEAAPGARSSVEEVRAATRLGRPFKVFSNDVTAFEIAVARRFNAHNQARGLPRGTLIDEDTRTELRTQVAREFFLAEYGREPDGSREWMAALAKYVRPKTDAVAGFDLTFSPVKSVSTLWAIAPPKIAAQIERAHNDAVAEALGFIEREALFTRRGANGVQQVDVRGLVAAAFVHRDSRAGDPDLHTHVAVANKVQAHDGTWLAIDARVLLKATVTASETYNSFLEKHLTQALGVRFEERPDPDSRKRPIREIIGVDPRLNEQFSKRRLSIEARRDQLVAAFQRDHGRPPTPVETLDLAQRATLETRDAKHDPRTLAEQRTAWQGEAIQVLGSPQAINRMVHTALAPPASKPVQVTPEWMNRTAQAVTEAMASRRSVWQFWHVYAEAQRQVRATNTPAKDIEAVAMTLTNRVLATSTCLAREEDPSTEPEALRRDNGESVYRVKGADLYTSTAVLDAEQRLVDAAGHKGGRAISSEEVGVALLESTANGVELNAGQATLVREMATSGARVQLAIAPAGAGKTTAMRVLASAWTAAGGEVFGLAPSAVAASELNLQLQDQRVPTEDGARTDTLAKLVYELDHGRLPDRARRIGPRTLVVIDEAGMADTISLDRVTSFVLSRGASIRFIGDDQQLAAIGAGGVLRDIRATHGALHLSELMRFSDPAEGAASLALREGRGEALGFYFDRGRVHVGDTATLTEDVFTAWRTDRETGLDAIMLAPTRDLVCELNQRARAHRLLAEADSPAGVDAAACAPTVRLGDGNLASVGDLIITRANDRRLRISATDWVKNGDRWLICRLDQDGISVKHLTTGRSVRLPNAYVAESTDLGYACTVHTAQGVTADTMHGLATGDESRQLLYTLMTRGRHANHVYLSMVGSGDPHTVIHPDVVHPKTPTEVLEQILARDESPRSATTLQREAADPAVQLAAAAARYTDALHVAAENVIGADAVEAIETDMETTLPGIRDEAAWPALRTHLMLLAAAGENPMTQVRVAVADGSMRNAVDRAAVLDWRLDASGARSLETTGPLPWLHGIPHRIAEDPAWGPYLTARAQWVRDLTERVEAAADVAHASGVSPAWLTSGAHLTPEVIAQIQVWRAAQGITDDDLRPTGPVQPQKLTARWQRRLARQLNGDRTPAILEWRHYLEDLSPAISTDDFTSTLAERLATMSRAGLNTRQFLVRAMTAGALPDDHAAAALWWRISAHLAPAVAARMDAHDQVITTAWIEELTQLVGAERAEALRNSTWWPAVVASIDHGLQRGWRIADLLNVATPPPPDIDEAQAFLWRASIAGADLAVLDATEVREGDLDDAPADLYEEWVPDPRHKISADNLDIRPSATQEPRDVSTALDRALLIKALIRDLRHLDPDRLFTPIDARRAFAHARQWDTAAMTRARMVQVNDLAATYYQQRVAAGWARGYLTSRLRGDISGDKRYRIGYAPTGWTDLVNHLRSQGVSDAEMVEVGLATRARTGNLIDRFRDRLMFPIITTTGEVIGFTTRRNPADDHDPQAGPKYLNTADNPLFHKGSQLYGLVPQTLADGAIPVITEGPMDAIAVTLASGGRHLGLAPLGTALTEDQTIQLAHIFQDHGVDPVLATDADPAGQKAAARDFWLLAGVGLDPSLATLPDGRDPAAMLEHDGPAALATALQDSRPLGATLLDRLLASPTATTSDLREAAFMMVAAQQPDAWADGLPDIAARFDITEVEAKQTLLAAITAWDGDPRKIAADQLGRQHTTGLAASSIPTPRRWMALCDSLDDRIVHDPAWPLLEPMLDELAAADIDVTAVLSELINDRPLGAQPVQDLRYRLAALREEQQVVPVGSPALQDPQIQRPTPTASGNRSANAQRPRHR